MQIHFITIFIFLTAACLGSFANVLIYRIPLDLSIFRPRSRCPSCATPIIWYDNIPIISYFLLKAKCRNCDQPIPVSYLLVELLTPAAFTGIWFLSSGIESFLIFGFFAFIIIVISFIDLKHSIIPDSLSMPAAIIGLLVSPMNVYLGSDILSRILSSLAGLICGGGIMYISGIIGKKIFKKEALGGGDIKLMALAGAFLGWNGVIYSLFFGSLIGTVISIFLIYVLKTKKWGDYIPYGPFLSAGMFIDLFFFVL